MLKHLKTIYYLGPDREITHTFDRVQEFQQPVPESIGEDIVRGVCARYGT